MTERYRTLVLREPTKTLRVSRSTQPTDDLLIGFWAQPHGQAFSQMRISEAGARKLVRLLCAKLTPGQYTERQRRLLREDLERIGVI